VEQELQEEFGLERVRKQLEAWNMLQVIRMRGRGRRRRRRRRKRRKRRRRRRALSSAVDFPCTHLAPLACDILRRPLIRLHCKVRESERESARGGSEMNK
jgi:hypothetical protein